MMTKFDITIKLNKKFREEIKKNKKRIKSKK
jgi:hypothetical protein